MSETKTATRSVFRRREVERLYEFRKLYQWTRVPHSTPFYFDYITSGKELCEKEIGRYDIEMPLLEVGEEIFLEDIKEPVRIISRMRSTDGSVTYYVEDKYVETENTTRTLAECVEQVRNFKELEEMLEKLRKEFYEYKRTHKFKTSLGIFFG